MKNCTLISSTNNKGFGLDRVKFLVDDVPYEYDIPAGLREIIRRKSYHNAWIGLGWAKRCGTLINRDLINE